MRTLLFLLVFVAAGTRCAEAQQTTGGRIVSYSRLQGSSIDVQTTIENAWQIKAANQVLKDTFSSDGCGRCGKNPCSSSAPVVTPPCRTEREITAVAIPPRKTINLFDQRVSTVSISGSFNRTTYDDHSLSVRNTMNQRSYTSSYMHGGSSSNRNNYSPRTVSSGARTTSSNSGPVTRTDKRLNLSLTDNSRTSIKVKAPTFIKTPPPIVQLKPPPVISPPRPDNFFNPVNPS